MLDDGLALYRQHQLEKLRVLVYVFCILLGLLGLIAFGPMMVARLNSYQPAIYLNDAPIIYNGWLPFGLWLFLIAFFVKFNSFDSQVS